MRSRRRTPAGGVQAQKQRRYVQLIGQGVSNSEACRLVGINRRTGTRWRFGRSVCNSAGEVLHYLPVKLAEARPRSLRYLSEQDRIRIADLLAQDVTVRGIARELGRSASTISREISRNRDPDGRYRPHHAEHAAGSGLAGPGSVALSRTPRWVRLSGGCWASAGARSRSLTSSASCSPASRPGGCARSRSTRRSTTLRSRSRGRCGVAAADDGSWGCSGVDG